MTEDRLGKLKEKEDFLVVSSPSECMALMVSQQSYDLICSQGSFRERTMNQRSWVYDQSWCE